MAHITCYSFILLIIILINSFEFVYSDDNNSNNFISILDKINSDKEICPITNNIKKSMYIKNCSKVEYPKSNVNLTDMQILCIGIYDRLWKMCVKFSKQNSTKDLSPILTNETLFDTNIKSNIAFNYINETALLLSNVTSTCNTIKISKTLIYDNIKNYTSLMENRLNFDCIQMCINLTNLPLCTAIKIIDNSLKLNLSNITTVTTLAASTTTSIKNNSANIKLPITINQNELVNRNKNKNLDEKTILPIDNSKKSTPNDKNNSAMNKVNNDDNEKTVVAPPPPVNDDNHSKKPNVEKKTEKIEGDNKNEGKLDKIESKISTISDQTADDDTSQMKYDSDSPLNEQHPNAEDLMNDIDDQNIIKDEVVDQQDNSINNLQNDESHSFFGYFTIIGFVGIASCLVYHHKQKILAMILEGRRSRGNRGRRRPSTASYRKLDCTLEEAVTSQCNSNPTHVIY